MSPYQQDVIDTTLREFDVQAAKGIPSIAAQAVGRGVLGGGREGVIRSEYQTTSDRNPSSITSTIITTRFWSSSNKLLNNNLTTNGTAQNCSHN